MPLATLGEGCSTCSLSSPIHEEQKREISSYEWLFHGEERAAILRAHLPPTHHIWNSQGILPVHLRDKTRGPPKLNCGRGEGMLPPLPFSWKEMDNSIWLLLNLVHWLPCKVCLWFQGNILQKDVLLAICNVGRIRFPLSISPLKGARKQMNIKS